MVAISCHLVMIALLVFILIRIVVHIKLINQIIMAKGKINVAVENIFPLIKRFLYSDHEIFLRELISNATDATLKLKLIRKVKSFISSIRESECLRMK